MLHAPADFPHPGSYAFVAGTAEEVRIIRASVVQGSVLVALVAPGPRAAGRASGNFTIALSRLAATRDAALSLRSRAGPVERQRAEAEAARADRSRA